MAQPGDFRLYRGQWQGLASDGLWHTFPSDNQEYLNSNFSGVRGTGSSQVFLPFEEDTNATPMASSSVIAALDQIDTARINDNIPQKSTKERFLEAWDEFSAG